MKKITCVIIIILAGLYILSRAVFAGVFEPLEKELEKRLPELIGPAKKYAVKIKAEDVADVAAGQIESLYLLAEEVAPKDCPAIEFVEVHLHNILFDTEKIEKIQSADFTVIVNENSINTYLPLKVKEYPDLKVELKDNLITVFTNKKLLYFDLPVCVSGALEVFSEKKVNFKCSNVTVGGMVLPDFARKYIEEEINPIVNLEEMKVVTDIKSIQILNKKIEIKGRAKVITPFYYGK